MACRFCTVTTIIYLIFSTDNAASRKHPSADTSDSLEMEKIDRRNMLENEWQYEGGMPIEVPANDKGLDDAQGKMVGNHEDGRSNRSRDYQSSHEIGGRRHNHEEERSPQPHVQAAPERSVGDKASPTQETPATLATPPADRRYRRIYNPDELASIQEYRFVAAVLVNAQLWCGAAIIAPDKVLTAAHCLQLQYNNRFFREYVKMLSVRVGSENATSGGYLLHVTEIFFHPNYKPQTLEFNFAVLKLHKNITFDRSGSKVDMIQYAREKTVPVDKQVLFLGWGSVLGVGGRGGAVLLQKVELPVYSLADCQEIYGRNLVTRTNFCAGFITLPKNVCNHDAGGPAIMNGLLVGILSFSSKRCDERDKPAVFSTVGAAAPWLEDLGETKLQLRHTAIKLQ